MITSANNLSAEERARKVKEGKKRILSIVESLLDEEQVDEGTLIVHCKYLCIGDYNDVVTERSLIKICGYPLCGQQLPEPPKQRYKISLAEHKVFDIEKRKMFCSNLCYKASQFLQEQLEEEPFWMKTSNVLTLPDVRFYRESKGAKGEEVLLVPQVEFGERDKKKTQPRSCMVKTKGGSNRRVQISAPYIKEERLDQLKESMKSLTIVERFVKEREVSCSKSECMDSDSVE